MPITALAPVVTLIANELFTRLERLITNKSASYFFCNVVRPTKLATYTPQHGTIVLTRGEQSRVPDLDCPGNPPAICWQQTFMVRVHIAPSERDATPIELFEDVAQAAIIKAIRNSDTWHTFDGNAINADFEAMVTTSSDGGYDGIAVPVNVVYRVAEDDPYTVRA
jgi:hypothetical protein